MAGKSDMKSYEDGLRDGKIEALEDVAASHKDRLDHHSSRLRMLERIIWALAGIVGFIEFWPKIQMFIQ